MSDSLIQVVITGGIAVIAALVTAVTQPLWANFITRKNVLEARIRLNIFKLPGFISNGIEEYALLQYKAGKFPKPTSETIDKLRKIKRCECFIELELINKSKNEINGVRINLNTNGNAIFEIQNPASVKITQFSHYLDIDTILPDSEIKIYAWSLVDFTERFSSSYLDVLKVTAKQYDKIIYRNYNHKILDRNFLLVKRKVVERIFFLTAIFLLTIVFPIILKITLPK